MKNLLLGTVSLLALAGVANAADLPRKAAPAPVVAVPVIPNWAGFYAGIQGGFAVNRGRFTDINGFNTALSNPGLEYKADKTGGLAGVNAGYNLQSGNLVYGVEADWSWVGAKAESGPTSAGSIRNLTTSFDVRWLATVRARLGITTGPLLIYATGGVAFADVKDNASVFGGAPLIQVGTFDISKTKTGYTAGGGIEYLIDPRWTVRAEGRYVDLGKTNVTCTSPCNGGGSFTYRGQFRNTMVTGVLGVDYKF